MRTSLTTTSTGSGAGTSRVSYKSRQPALSLCVVRLDSVMDCSDCVGRVCAEALSLPGFVSWNILEAEGEAKTQGAGGQKR